MLAAVRVVSGLDRLKTGGEVEPGFHKSGALEVGTRPVARPWKLRAHRRWHCKALCASNAGGGCRAGAFQVVP